MKKYIILVVVLISILAIIKDFKKTTIPETPIVEDPRIAIIDKYYADRNMPLEGYGKKMVEVSDKNRLDWRLLVAISIRETSGGKHMCRKFNAFGWGSCKIEFSSHEEAIETIAYKLSNLPCYKGATTEHKLYHYNGTVIKTYPKEVIKIMNTIKPS
jgi:hypothetical protein